MASSGRPDATRVTHLAKQEVDLNGDLTEANGFNVLADLPGTDPSGEFVNLNEGERALFVE